MNARLWLEYMATKRIAVVCAHPDDETLALGSQLTAIVDLTLIHVTDGVNKREEAEGRHLQKAATRRKELAHALEKLGVTKAQCFPLKYLDQDVIWSVVEVIAQLVILLRDVEVVITHPYEGAHPDHDACALAVFVARTYLLKPPRHLEFASYHLKNRVMVTNEFWFQKEAGIELAMELDEHALEIKRAALECFSTQEKLIKKFMYQIERIREAPRYDFGAPPPPRAVHYDRCTWGVTGDTWRKKARAVLAALGVSNGMHQDNRRSDPGSAESTTSGEPDAQTSPSEG